MLPNEMDGLDLEDEPDVFEQLALGMEKLVAMHEQQMQVMVALVQQMQRVEQAISAPRRVVRDQATGKAIGAEPVRG